jgi:hypothetical protein
MQPLMPSSTADEDSDEGDEMIPAFGLLNLCSDRIDAVGVYLLDTPDLILVYVCRSVSQQFTSDVLNCQSFNQLCEMVRAEIYSPNNDKELINLCGMCRTRAVSACCLWGALWRTGVPLRGTTPVTTSSFRKFKILSNR